MTHKENITAILECYFPGHKEEIIESACNRILEQELTTKDDLGVDAVNREELLKIYEDRFLELQELKHSKYHNKGAEDRQMGINYCINILEEMPPVTLQPKTGHWIQHRYFIYECSECHNTGSDCFPNRASSFCPDCGAKMEEGD